MVNSNREEQIRKEVAHIEQSTLSAKEYIEHYDVSFSLAQFYRYRAKFNKEGTVGLRDKRQYGNHRKLGREEIAFLRGFIKDKPYVTPVEAQQAIANG